jgi:hypothetical protein
MATAYTAICTVRNEKGQMTSIPLAGDDVTAHALTFPDGSTSNKLSSVGSIIVDWIFVPTDIAQIKVFINGFDTGIRIQKSGSAGTTVNRMVQSAPISVPAGAMVSFYQLT